MILEDFFTYYLEKISEKNRLGFLELAGGAAELASMFGRSDRESLDFLLRFHTLLERLRLEHPGEAIIFNKSDNVCFPFFIDYAWRRLPPAIRTEMEEHFGGGPDRASQLMSDSREERNWFRRRISTTFSQEDLFSLNEAIALQNFGSGGEYSFLTLVLPRLQSIKGRVLDGGCGAGFSSLVLSQYFDVCGIDACPPRVNRARALAGAMKEGERGIFTRVMKFMQNELGILGEEVDFPDAASLLAGRVGEIDFRVGSLDRLPYEDRAFDTVLCMDVLEHTYDPQAIISQFARVTRPGAHVFITAPNTCGEVYQKWAENEEGAAFPALLHMHHFEPETLNRIFGRWGFEPMEIHPFDFIDREKFAVMAADDEKGQKLLASGEEEIPMQLFAIYRRRD